MPFWSTSQPLLDILVQYVGLPTLWSCSRLKHAVPKIPQAKERFRHEISEQEFKTISQCRWLAVEGNVEISRQLWVRRVGFQEGDTTWYYTTNMIGGWNSEWRSDEGTGILEPVLNDRRDTLPYGLMKGHLAIRFGKDSAAITLLMGERMKRRVEHWTGAFSMKLTLAKSICIV